jgi:hypothetical protein
MQSPNRLERETLRLKASHIKQTGLRLINCVDRKYLLTAGAMGLLYAVVTPPFQVPDEPNHFYRAYQVSSGEVSPRGRTIC